MAVKTFIVAHLFMVLLCCTAEQKKRQSKLAPNDPVLHAASKDAIDSARYRADKGQLSGRTQTLDLYYAAIACTCAQWIDGRIDADGAREYYYLERAHADLMDADSLYDGQHLPLHIRVTGRFYEKPGYPAGYFPAKADPDPAPVFRYEMIKVIQPKAVRRNSNG